MTTWLLLRGLTRESGHWGSFAEQFQHALPGSPMLALDLPGSGRWHAGVSPSTVAGLLAHCRAELAEQRMEPPYQLLGMSLGAMVAVAWAQAHPQEIQAQVLINTSMRPFNPFWQRLQPANYARLLCLALPGVPAASYERAVMQLTANEMHEDALSDWLAIHRERPVSRANALRQLMAAARFEAARAPPFAPTLLLASEHDHLVSPACSRTLARLWQCPLRMHPRAGHDLPLDDGPWVADQVRLWLNESRQTPDPACGW